jgi:hypothetical protein
MAQTREQQLQTAREIDRASTALINVGVAAVKKNKFKVAGYLFGLLLCVFFTGWKITDGQRAEYYTELEKLDSTSLHETGGKLQGASNQYYRSKGWFSCDAVCQSYKADMQAYQRLFDTLKAEENTKLARAKSKLGVFSEYGVEEARGLFWERFAQGKGFAQRQTMWDAIFFGVGSMGRDEKMVSYIMRLVLSFVFNFTIGVMGAVLVFMGGLFSLIRSFQPDYLSAVAFFGLASLAAISFALTWLLGLYVATAGTVYVGAKLIAGNMRIEGGDGGRRPELRGRAR